MEKLCHSQSTITIAFTYPWLSNCTIKLWNDAQHIDNSLSAESIIHCIKQIYHYNVLHYSKNIQYITFIIYYIIRSIFNSLFFIFSTFFKCDLYPPPFSALIQVLYRKLLYNFTQDHLKKIKKNTVQLYIFVRFYIFVEQVWYIKLLLTKTYTSVHRQKD